VKRPDNSTAPSRTDGVSENSQSPLNPTPKASAKKGIEEENNDQ
jgi:hypothetical protein